MLGSGASEPRSCVQSCIVPCLLRQSGVSEVLTEPEPEPVRSLEVVGSDEQQESFIRGVGGCLSWGSLFGCEEWQNFG